jgi:outer membrane lipoprotein-sorting protein
MGRRRTGHWLAIGGVAAVVSAVSVSAAAKTASFSVAATHAGQGVQVTVNSKVWLTPTQARADLKHPLQGELTFLVNDGSFYQLDPKSKRGMKGPLPPDFKKQDNFAALLRMFAFDADSALKVAKKVRTETVAGYSCDVMVSNAKNGDASRNVTIWMPHKMDPKIPLKAIMKDQVNKPGASVSQTVTIQLSNIRLNQAIPASTFAVPAGYRIETGTPKPPNMPRPGK